MVIDMNKKYLIIYNDIVNKIDNGDYGANYKLASEKEMMNEYSVSRDTVRKSLNMLEQNGYIQKKKGKGSFVVDINKFNFPVSGVVSFKEISQKLGKESQTIVELLELKKPKRNIAYNLEINEDEEVWEILRTRTIGGEKVILDKDYIPRKFVNVITKEVCKNSLYDYFENQLNLQIAYAKKEITVQRASEEDRKYLDIKDFDMVVVVKSFTYLDDTSLFQYTESRHRPDKFVFVDFARRSK